MEFPDFKLQLNLQIQNGALDTVFKLQMINFFYITSVLKVKKVEIWFLGSVVRGQGFNIQGH